MNNRFHIFLVICLLSTIQSFGGYRNDFIRFGVEDGLSQRWVRCLHQDKYGFIWLGTKDGLNRYDGSEFRIYRASDTNTFRLGNSTINAIHEQSNGNLWIATDRGLYIYQRKFDNFVPFEYLNKYAVTCIVKTFNGNFWFGSESGLFFFNPTNKKIKHYVKNEKSSYGLNENNILSLLEDSNHRLWIGTQRGINILRQSDSAFIQLYKNDQEKWLQNLEVNTIIEDNFGHIFIGTSGGGLDVFDKNQDIDKPVTLNRILTDNIVTLLIDSKNRLFLGKGGGGGFLISDLTHTLSSQSDFKSYKNIPGNLNSLSDNSVECFLEDKSGDIWIGTYGKGVNLYSERNYNFNQVKGTIDYNNLLINKLVNVILEEEQYLWIGTEVGLNRIDKKTGKIKLFIHEFNNPKSIGANAVYDLFKDRAGNLWIGTWNGGLNKYNYKDQNFTRYIHNNFNSKSIGSSRVFKIYQDTQNRLWIGTIGGGLNEYDYSSDSFISYNTLKKQSPELGTDYVNDIIQTSDGLLWFSSCGALNLFDPESKKIVQYFHNPDKDETISDGDIMILFEDSNSNFWIGCEGGLNLFDRVNNQFTRYTTQDGLPNNSIKSILEDNNGNLWLASNDGITKFIDGTKIPESPEFLNFNKSDGLKSMGFIKRSAYRNDKNILYFGGINGYTFFCPDSIYNKPFPVDILLTDLLIFNNKIMPGKESKILPKELYLLNQIYLSFKESVFTIKYTSNNYLNPEKVNYAYKLEGFDKDWQYVGNQRYATYTNIDAGDYVFKVKYSLDNKLWNEKQAAIKVHISPPWWKTAWVKFSLIISILFLIFFHNYIRTYRLKLVRKELKEKIELHTSEIKEANQFLEESKEEITLQNEELSKHRNELEKLVKDRTNDLELALKKAKESDNLKSAFLANISHEIRTPMNAILGFTTFLDDISVSEEAKARYLKLINSNSKSLLLLLDDVIDQSLINSNQINLIPEIFNVTEMLSDLEATFNINNPKSLVIRFDNTENKLPVYLKADKSRLKQCLTNLIGNAYKFTNEGFVYFGFNIVVDRIIFYVSDSGIGISYNEKEKIFKQFYKIESDNEKVYRGAGLGLSIAKYLVKLMNGEIWFESIKGKGSTFYISMPYSNEYFEDKTTPETINNNIELTNYTILIAEDENTNYLLIKEILLKTNANIVRAFNGAEAVEYAENHNNVSNLIILMDIKMPVMNGFKAYDKIKKINKNIPVIAVTAYTTKPDLDIIKSYKFHAYLAKPFKGVELLKIIEDVIQTT